jgi:hypothetical protein
MRDDIQIFSLADRASWEQAEIGAAPSQCWRYAAALALSGYDPRLAIVTAGGSRLSLPYCERLWQGRTDVTTLPGLSGASIAPPSSAPLTRWLEFATANGWVSGYIQLSAESYPNVPPDASPVHQTHTFVLDTSAWDRNRTPSLIIRRKIASALRAGAVAEDDRAKLGARLRQLYPETLTRYGARSVLRGETIDAWSRDPHTLLLGISVEDTVEGVHLIHVHETRAELHLVGVSERGRSLSALLFAWGIERLRTMGVTRYNLGGGGDPGDGLFRFKRWLGAAPVSLQSIRQIYDARAYASLCAAAGVKPDAAWFPAYRSVDELTQTDSGS